MKKDPILLRRVYVLIAVMGLWGTVIGARLYFLQVVQSGSYRERADEQQQKAVTIVPPRGSILDSNGNPLAVSVPVKTIFARPGEISDVDAAAKTLSAITGESVAAITEKLRTSDKQVFIKRDAADAEVSAVEKSNLTGIGVFEESHRQYPNNDLAAQVLGFVGSDEKGLGGLEYQYEEALAGSSGKVVYVKDGKQRRYNQSEQPAQSGANLITTLDKSIQFVVRQAVHDAIARTHAAAIYVGVMDPRNGAILAIENYPSFDPNNWGDYNPQFRKNGAIQHTYEPGSTFKILTVGAALEEGLTTPDERIDCLLGSIVVAGHRIHDHKPFGVLSVSEIMQKSSDVGAITLGLRLKEERMASYIKRYGFGKKTGIDLPGEEGGTAKSVSKWNKSSIGYMSMGQEIAVTPLQILSLVSTVGNGGTLYRPFVVKEIQNSQHEVVSRTEPVGLSVMSPKTAREMQEILEKVVTDGTATSAKLDGYRAAGKTGTAQKSDGAGYSATKLVASFAGYAPASNPVISIVVVVDEPQGAHHGGEVAAPIFKQIADQILRNRGISPDIEGYNPRYVPPPARRQSAPASEVKPSETEGLKIINASFPASMTARTFQTGDIPVPDLRGKTDRQAFAESRLLGLKAKFEGIGRIRQQNPAPGTLVSRGTVVDLWLSAR
jgi:cell division protein FtsI (penicillin-binding protein 3)